MKRYLLLVFLAVIWSGCKKDDDTQPQNAFDSKICKPTSVKVAGASYNFMYDVDGKVIRETIKSDTAIRFIYDYEYTGNKLSKIKQTYTIGTQVANYDVTSDNSGRITELANEDRSKVYSYVYDNSSRIIEASRRTNGILELQSSYKYNANTVTLGNGIYEMDYRPNPLINSIHYIVFQSFHFPNNPISFSLKNSEGVIEVQEKYQYNYNSSGYPINGVQHNLTTGDFMNWSYTYTCK